jgi:hypothetical protein
MHFFRRLKLTHPARQLQPEPSARLTAASCDWSPYRLAASCHWSPCLEASCYWFSSLPRRRGIIGSFLPPFRQPVMAVANCEWTN